MTSSRARPAASRRCAALDLTPFPRCSKNLLDLFPEDRGAAAALLAAAVMAPADAPPAVAHLRAPAAAGDEPCAEKPYGGKSDAARCRTFLEAKLSSDVRRIMQQTLPLALALI